jgi:hypothetical protein
MITGEWVFDRNQTFWMLDFGSLEHGIEVIGTAHLKRLQRNPGCPGGTFGLFENIRRVGIGRIPEDRHP